MQTRNWAILSMGLMVLGAGFAMADTHYVARNGQTPQSPYTNGWGSAASNIQEAVNVSTAGDTVLVAPGVYGCPPSPVVTAGVTNMVNIEKFITVRGSSGNPADTIIDAGGWLSNRCVRINTQLAAAGDSTVRVSGFTLTNGYATGGGVLFDVSNWVRTGVVDNCVITDNRGLSGRGAGIDIYYTGSTGPNIVISNTVVRNSTGAGIWKRLPDSTVLTLADSRIEFNSPNGLYLYNGTTIVERCVFRGNRKALSNYGVAIDCFYGFVTVRNSLFHENHFEPDVGGYGGAAISANTTIPYMENCTIVSNTATGGSDSIPGIYAHHNGSYRVRNTIAYHNYRGATHVNFGGSGSVVFTNSCSTGTMTGTNNITSTPQFVDVAGLDFHLARNSPCINAGINQDWMNGATDLDGRPRIDWGTSLVDMGCFEFEFPGGTLILTR